jgi:CMP/dCMP kinase
MNKLSEGPGRFVHLIERQMLLHERRGKPARQAVGGGEGKEPYRFITISRDIGALGTAVASKLALRLQWKVYDKEIVEYIAQNNHIQRNLVEQLDEKTQSLIQESVERWLLMFQGQSYSRDEYHVALIKALIALAAQGHSILLGRGGAYVLQDHPGLHVRITASLPVRVRRLGRQWETSIEKTERIVLRTDAERKEFIHRHFKPDRNEGSYFHLIFNTDNLSVDYVAAAIMGIIEQSRKPAALQQPSAPDKFIFQNSEQPLIG